MTISVQQQRSQLFKAASQLVELSRCGACVVFAAPPAMLSFSMISVIPGMTTLGVLVLSYPRAVLLLSFDVLA